jgi:hypothetical protein
VSMSASFTVTNLFSENSYPVKSSVFTTIGVVEIREKSSDVSSSSSMLNPSTSPPAMMSEDTEERRDELLASPEIIYLCCLITLVVFVSLSLLGFWQVRMVALNLTTIEFYQNEDHAKLCAKYGEVFRNPYDLGFSRNWSQFFNVRGGPSKWAWLKLSLSKTLGDGHSFETVGKTGAKAGASSKWNDSRIV